jgi:hypothetical protein
MGASRSKRYSRKQQPRIWPPASGGAAWSHRSENNGKIDGFRRILGDSIFGEILWRVARVKRANAIPNALPGGRRDVDGTLRKVFQTRCSVANNTPGFKYIAEFSSAAALALQMLLASEKRGPTSVPRLPDVKRYD